MRTDSAPCSFDERAGTSHLPPRHERTGDGRMADADAAVAEKSVRLQVAAARQEESGQGIARLPRSAFQALGITEGDVLEITGKRTTAAIAMPAYEEDQSLDVV